MSALEKAARAIIDLDGRHGLAYSEAEAERLALRYARAVLMSLREEAPTVHRVSATTDGSYSDIVTIRRDGWENLIDAILNEGQA